jgi:hypothetical protein
MKPLCQRALHGGTRGGQPSRDDVPPFFPAGLVSNANKPYARRFCQGGAVNSEQQATPHSTIDAASSGVTPGWDPYEVWRTRVFLPRVASEDARLLRTTPVVTLCVVVPAATDDVARNGGQSDPTRAQDPRDEALRHELLTVLSSLCLAGLTSLFLSHGDRRTAGVRPRDVRAK